MKNKELKVGDKIWIYCACLAYDQFYTVKTVKKSGLLVAVTIESTLLDYKPFTVQLFGHASSSILSGYHRNYAQVDMCFTCDYELIRRKTRQFEEEEKVRSVGYAALRLKRALGI